MGTKYCPFDSTEKDAINLEIYQKEVNESEESINRCLPKLKLSIKDLNDDLKCCLDEEFLLRFLRISKFDCKKALQRIQNFYNSQEKYLNVFKTCPMTISRAQKYRFIRACPFRLENNSLVVISRPGSVDFSNLSADEKLYLDVIIAIHLISNPVTQICGVNLIIDFNGFGFKTMRAYSLGRLRLILDILVNVIPFRVLSVHCINTPAIFPKMCNLAKPILPNKIQERVHVHPNNDNWESLHAHIPADILPEEFGGRISKSSMIDLLDDVERMELLFRDQLKFGYKKTEHLRENWSCIQFNK